MSVVCRKKPLDKWRSVSSGLDDGAFTGCIDPFPRYGWRHCTAGGTGSYYRSEHVYQSSILRQLRQWVYDMRWLRARRHRYMSGKGIGNLRTNMTPSSNCRPSVRHIHVINAFLHVYLHTGWLWRFESVCCWWQRLHPVCYNLLLVVKRVTPALSSLTMFTWQSVGVCWPWQCSQPIHPIFYDGSDLNCKTFFCPAGDCGGPLVYGGAQTLHGVTSWGSVFVSISLKSPTYLSPTGWLWGSVKLMCACGDGAYNLCGITSWESILFSMCDTLQHVCLPPWWFWPSVCVCWLWRRLHPLGHYLPGPNIVLNVINTSDTFTLHRATLAVRWCVLAMTGPTRCMAPPLGVPAVLIHTSLGSTYV